MHHLLQSANQSLPSHVARKYKIPTLQDGHAYLTSHRVCYVDDVEPRKRSVAVELKGIEKYEFYVRLSHLHYRKIVLSFSRLAFSNHHPKYCFIPKPLNPRSIKLEIHLVLRSVREFLLPRNYFHQMIPPIHALPPQHGFA